MRQEIQAPRPYSNEHVIRKNLVFVVKHPSVPDRYFPVGTWQLDTDRLTVDGAYLDNLEESGIHDLVILEWIDESEEKNDDNEREEHEDENGKA